jgi:hypothetical protein
MAATEQQFRIAQEAAATAQQMLQEAKRMQQDARQKEA